MDIQACFGRAFQIWKRTRKLWLLGFLAVLTGTGGINTSFNVNLPASEAEDLNIPQIDEDMIFGYLQWVQENLLLLGLFFVAALLLMILIQLLLAAWVQGAMIDLAAKSDMGQEFSIRSSFGAAAKRLPSLTGVMLALRIPTFITVAAAIVIVLNIISQIPGWLSSDSFEQTLATFFGVFFCSIILILLGSLLQLLCSFLEPLALRVCLFEEQAVWASVRRSFGLIRQNLGLTFLSWFGMGIVAAVIGMILSFMGIFIVVIGISSTSSTMTYLLIAIGLVLFFGLAIGLGGLFASYLATLWNVVYRACITPKSQNPAPTAPQPYMQ